MEFASAIDDVPGSRDASTHDPHSAAPKPKAKSKIRAGPKPRVDIDNQITEANRLSEVLKRVSQAAKTAAKNGSRAKKRLVRKAGKLSSEDLERIAVLKGCGLFTGVIAGSANSSDGGDVPSQDEDSMLVDNLVVHNKISAAMENIPGAKDVFP